MSTRILVGDCRTALEQLPAGSVHCVVTSPPYYAQRDYGHPDQIGLESTPDLYVAAIVECMASVHRVLADDGTVWLNVADTYAGDRGAAWGPSPMTTESRRRDNTKVPRRDVRVAGIRPKNLLLIPARLAIALQEWGWWVRQDIVWSKPNPMPESCGDRCTKAHEYVWLLSKSERYFFDWAAIAEPAVKAGQVLHRSGTGAKAREGANATNDSRTRTGLANWDQPVPDMRRARSVWTIPTFPSPLPHFAMMAPALAERCIAAGTSQSGHCPACGARWARQTELVVEAKHEDGETATAYAGGSTAGRLAKLRQAASAQGREYTATRVTTGWVASCGCGLPPVPDVVLDPFGGAGTTGLVADRMGRDAILVELNPAYAATAQQRIAGESPLFAEVS